MLQSLGSQRVRNDVMMEQQINNVWTRAYIWILTPISMPFVYVPLRESAVCQRARQIQSIFVMESGGA